MTDAHAKKNESLRVQGRRPEWPADGYEFGESICLTPGCGAVVKHEISLSAPWQLHTDHVICGRCAATYKVTVEEVDAARPQVTFKRADDRQS